MHNAHTYIKNQLLRYMIVTKDTQYGLTCDMTVAFLFLHQELSTDFMILT